MKNLLRSIFAEVHPFWFKSQDSDEGTTRQEAMDEIIRANPWVQKRDRTAFRTRTGQTPQVAARKPEIGGKVDLNKPV